MSNLTKKALLASFGALIEKKPFDKITVSALTAKCGLNRMTFYYHFQDIYELLIWGLKTQVLEAVNHDCITYANWKNGYLSLFYFALQQKTYITKIFQTMKQEHLEHYLNQIAEEMVVAVIDDKCRDHVICDADKHFTAQVCAHVLVGTLLNWVNNNMKDPPEMVIKRVGCLLDGMIDKTINGFEPSKGAVPEV